MPVASAGQIRLRGGTLTAPVDIPPIVVQPGRVNLRGGAVSVAPLVPSSSPVPRLVVRRYQGATILDTDPPDPGFTDVNLGPIVQQANGPTTCTLTIPIARPDLVSLLVDDNLEGRTPIQGCAVELVRDGDLLPRMNVVSARLTPDLLAVDVGLADRRYELDRRYVGRVGERPNLTPPWDQNSTAPPDGWALTTNGGDVVTGSFYPGPGPFGPTDVNAIEFENNGIDDDYVEAVVAPSPVPFDRVFYFAGWFYLPQGAWAPSTGGVIADVNVYDVDLPGNLTTQPEPVLSTFQPSNRWVLFYIQQRIPANASYEITVRAHPQFGISRFSDLNTAVQEGLFWADEDLATIVTDLVDHAYDFAYSHADTGLRADASSIPATGQSTSRHIVSDEKQQVSDAVAQVLAMGHLWSWVTANGDGSDQLHVTQMGDITEITAGDDNATIDGWEWSGDRATEILGLFSPSWSDFTNSRLVVTYGPDGRLTDRGGRYLLGRERYQVGPYGGASPDAFDALCRSVYRKENAALATKVRLAPSGDTLTAALTGTLKPGNFMDCNIGGFPRGLIGRFRIIAVSADPATAVVEVTLNRETV